jgi:hypothetical protein
MLYRVPTTDLIARRRKSARRLIPANDNAPCDAYEWRTLWLPLLAIWAVLPIVVLAGIIAAVVFL